MKLYAFDTRINKVAGKPAGVFLLSHKWFRRYKHEPHNVRDVLNTLEISCRYYFIGNQIYTFNNVSHTEFSLDPASL